MPKSGLLHSTPWFAGSPGPGRWLAADQYAWPLDLDGVPAFTTTMIDGIPVIVAPDGIDIATHASMRRELAAALALGRPVIIDMTGTTFCDIAGLRELTMASKSLKAAGLELHLAYTQPPSIMRHVLVNYPPRISPSVTDALVAVRQSRRLKLQAA